MIAELFYPKDLKKIIEELSTSKKLNERAIHSFKADVLRTFIPMALLFLLVASYFLVVEESVFLATITAFSSILTIPILASQTWRVYYAGYIDGKMNKGKVKKVSYSRNGDRKLIVENAIENRIDQIHLSSRVGRNTPNIGDEVCYLVNSAKYSVLYTQELQEKYCMKKHL